MMIERAGRETLRSSSSFGARGNRRGRRRLRRCAFSAVAATSTAPAARFLARSFSGFGIRLRGILRGRGSDGIIFRVNRGERLLTGRRGCGNRRRRRERITKRRSRITWNYFCTEPDGGFLGFGFPVRPSKSLRGGDVPFCSFRILAGRFEVASQLERDHGVAGFFEQIGKLPNGIFTGASPTNAGRDLFPVSHVLACIVAVEA